MIEIIAADRIRIDGGTQPRLQIDMAAVEDYAGEMQAGAVFPPVAVFFDGVDYWLADGFHRYHAASRINGKALSCDVHKGTQRDAILYSAHANATNGMRRTNADKRRAVETLLNDKEWAKWSDRKIAEACAVDKELVGRIRCLSGGFHQIDQVRTVERGGTVYQMQTAGIGRREPEEKALVYDREEQGDGIVKCSLCGKLYDGLAIEFCPYCAYTQEQRVQYLNHEQQKPHVSHNSGNNEWYTPLEYIEAAHAVMGGIDLDPASSEIANRIVKAKRFYSAENDGLAKKWHGRVWMNPPYAADLIGRFADKLSDHVRAGDVPSAIVLVNNATETGWFRTLVEISSAIVFPRNRVKFIDQDGNPTGMPLQGQAVLYCGIDHELFLKHFGKFGWGTARLIC